MNDERQQNLTAGNGFYTFEKNIVMKKVISRMFPYIKVLFYFVIVKTSYCNRYIIDE